MIAEIKNFLKCLTVGIKIDRLLSLQKKEKKKKAGSCTDQEL